MSENCTHDCSTCGAACASRTDPQDLHEKPNEYTQVKKMIGVVSGKGGVGKSMVTSLLSVLMQRQGYKTAILDADMTGPSIPRAFGIHEQALSSEIGLTVFQSLPLDGIVVVATPQELVGMIVEKAVKMADMMNIPVLGLVENMASFRCPDCGKVHRIFGESHADEIAKNHGISPVCRLPINPKLAAAVDAGDIELAEEDGLDGLAAKLAGMLQ